MVFTILPVDQGFVTIRELPVKRTDQSENCKHLHMILSLSLSLIHRIHNHYHEVEVCTGFLPQLFLQMSTQQTIPTTTNKTTALALWDHQEGMVKIISPSLLEHDTYLPANQPLTAGLSVVVGSDRTNVFLNAPQASQKLRPVIPLRNIRTIAPHNVCAIPRPRRNPFQPFQTSPSKIQNIKFRNPCPRCPSAPFHPIPPA